MKAPIPVSYTHLTSIFGLDVLANKIKAGPNRNITSAAKWFFLIGKISDKIPIVGFAISAAVPNTLIT